VLSEYSLAIIIIVNCMRHCNITCLLDIHAGQQAHVMVVSLDTVDV